MRFSGKPHHQLDGEIEETTDGKRWVIAGITSRSPLKPINISSSGITVTETEDQDQCPTTPTAVSFRIPRVLPCPAAPKKRKPSTKCSYGTEAKVFFSPPDLETVFIQRAS
ncbi:Cyclin-dependent protein kinase inhibitor SMR8 [Cardamine amara subsp. amara]|uniref:Cyclin-dependent protein kinase inhibitor SMR8 n=1 Tax=Cardamine amara subsp. amara TaxID=228776 RepID=A0ABD1C0B0_CARAN